MAAHDSLHSLLDYECLLLHCDEWRTENHSSLHHWNPLLSLSLMLRPTVSRPVCLGIKHPSGAYDQIFVTARQLRVCWYGALSLWREDGSVVYYSCWPSPAQLFSGPSTLGLATIFYSLFTCGLKPRSLVFLVFQIWDFPFRRLLRHAGLWWSYSTPPPHGSKSKSHCDWRSVNLYGVEPHLGLMTRYLLLLDSYGLVFVGRSLWREDGSVFYICCWPSPA
jgi:hypothetical protein